MGKGWETAKGGKLRRRLGTAAVAIALFVLALAPAALAVTYGPFTKNCASEWVSIHSYARYDVGHYYPSGTLQVLYDNSSGYQPRDSHTGVHSTSWKVTANDAIIVGSTYAECVPFG